MTLVIPCGTCEKVYFGETGKSFETRLNEHKRDFRTAAPGKAIVEHAGETGHFPDWKSAHLIYKCSNYIKRRLLESAMINSYPHTNTSPGSFQINKYLNQVVIKECLKVVN